MQDVGDKPLPSAPATTSTTTSASAKTDNTDLIRNLVQTHAEYPIIKMVPDAVVYIDNLPYVFNDYIGSGKVVVNINDFVTAASGAASTDTWIPQCSITLSIPNDLKYLLQAPGGQRILKTMSDVKVFTKGYYLTDKGESVYLRTFWGILSSVTYADNHKTLEVSLTCSGIMKLFDLMQYNGSPSAMTATSTTSEVVGWGDKTHGLNAFEIILEAFMAPLVSDIFDTTTVVESNERPPEDMFQRMYVTKWSAHLRNLQKAVRLFGLTKQSVNEVDAFIRKDPSYRDASLTNAGRSGAWVMTKDEIQRLSVADDALIRDYAPNYRIGTVTLLQSAVTSRLARIQAMVDLMGWEGYQDLDGSIIIKPPLYNLDCTNTTLTGANPFVINLPEVCDTESDVEDEAQVRLTRMSVKGLLISNPMLEGNVDVVPTAMWMDPALVRQFGLRQEPPKTIPFISNNDYALFGYAVAELNKINRHRHTYTVTIPMRPELRLGFPIYVAHLDIYAYLENITWNYQRGGRPTMTLSCTNVRCRELYAFPKKTAEGQSQWIYLACPNLEWVWCAAGNTSQSVSPDNKVTTNPKGSMGTLPAKRGSAADLTEQQKAFLAMKKANGGDVSVAVDDVDNAWRVSENAGHFDHRRAVDESYFNDITHVAMPYTDSKGYEVLRPFPWGRYETLENALDKFTRSPKRKTGGLLPYKTGEAGGDSPYIMSALASPDSVTQELDSTLANLSQRIEDDLNYFILSYTQAETTKAKATNPYTVDSDIVALQPGGAPSKGSEAPKTSTSVLDKASAAVQSFTSKIKSAL